MKSKFLLIAILYYSLKVHAQQNVGIGTTTPNSSAVLDITSTNKGVLLPRLTMAQRDAISSPANGLAIYQTDNSQGIYYYTGTKWLQLNAGVKNTGAGTNGQLALWSGTNSLTGVANVNWDNTNTRLNVSSSNPGYGTTNWITGNFGASVGDRVVVGVLNGQATIGAHSNGLNAWRRLIINPDAETYIGQLTVGALAGLEDRMVVTTPGGALATQPIPTSNVGTVTNVTADTTLGNPVTIINSSSSPIINIPAASATRNGYLSSADWTRFNNNTSGSGSTTNYKTGGILFGENNTTIQDSTNFFWNNTTKQLKLSSSNDGASSTNWISLNVGANDTANKDRVVIGSLNGGATIGAHNTALTSWGKLSINPSGATNSIILGGETTLTEAPHITTSPVTGYVEGAHNMPVIVNGSIKQATYHRYILLDNSAGRGTALGGFIYWNHNLGYKPTLMLSFENTALAESAYSYTYTHINDNQIRFMVIVTNAGATVYGGNLHWIVVR